MDPSAIAGLCALLSRGQIPAGQAQRAGCPPAAAVAPPAPATVSLAAALSAPEAREAIARVSFAEAGNQGDSGLAGVAYTILNRVLDGRWGRTVEAAVNARGQFEPVMRAGGDWRRLPAVGPERRARIDTILNLALDGRLPDLTHGARYFQNPVVVMRRAETGQVSPNLVAFGGSTPSAVIGAHHFYVGAGRGGGLAARRDDPPPQGLRPRVDAGLIVGENRIPEPTRADQAIGSPPRYDPSHALFVGADGRVVPDGG